MVAAQMPADPAELKPMFMYGFGAIPNLEVSVTPEEPLKRRLRPRRDKMEEAPDADVFIVNVRQRSSGNQRQSSSIKFKPKPRKTPNRAHKSVKAKPGSKHLPIEILDSEKKAASSDT